MDETQPALLLGPCDDLPGGYWVETHGTAKDPDEGFLPVRRHFSQSLRRLRFWNWMG